MKLITLPKSGLALCALLLSAKSFSQIQESPIKGQWGLSAGVTGDQYKTGIMYFRMRTGVLPMLTYTYGKNQFELGYQFQPNRLGRTVNEYHGITFHYKRYFNGFGDRLCRICIQDLVLQLSGFIIFTPDFTRAGRYKYECGLWT